MRPAAIACTPFAPAATACALVKTWFVGGKCMSAVLGTGVSAKNGIAIGLSTESG